MLRFISFLFNKPYEECKGCEVLKQQLTIANEEKKQLTETLLSLVKPKTYEAPAIELQPIQSKVGLWSRRRAELERQDRETARTLRDSKNIGRPDGFKEIDNISKLEEEVGISEEVK